jgi:hypothetical protein
MSEPIVSIDTSEVRPGRLDEVNATFIELAEFVDANEAQPIAYQVYLNEDESVVTVLQVHPDSASMEFHMDVAAAVFAKFKDLLTLVTMDVYGKPSEELLERMRNKARMLGTARVGVHELHAGFTRLGK